MSLRVQDLVAGYGATVVLDGISLEVARGGALAILGRNGAGKTSLLRTLMGYTTRQRGSITLDGQPLESLPVAHSPLVLAVPTGTQRPTGA